jgi:5-methyltetrahydropteroyltriglutamate--homocysteine methyltransferase
VAKEKIIASTNCGMAPMHRHTAAAKLEALAKGASMARQALGLNGAVYSAMRGRQFT